MSQTLEKYFVPEPSTYPLMGSVALLLMGAGASFWVNALEAGPWMVAAGFAVLIYMLFGWFGAVARESEGGPTSCSSVLRAAKKRLTNLGMARLVWSGPCLRRHLSIPSKCRPCLCRSQAKITKFAPSWKIRNARISAPY